MVVIEPEPLVEPSVNDMITPLYSVEYLPATKFVGAEGAVLLYGVTERDVDASEYPPFTVLCLRITVYALPVYGNGIVPLPEISLYAPDKLVQVDPAFVLYCILLTEPDSFVFPDVNITVALFIPGIRSVIVGLDGTPYGLTEIEFDEAVYPPLNVLSLISIK